MVGLLWDIRLLLACMLVTQVVLLAMVLLVARKIAKSAAEFNQKLTDIGTPLAAARDLVTGGPASAIGTAAHLASSALAKLRRN